VDATGMAENGDAARTGGKIARRARLVLEARARKKVVKGENYLPPGGMKKVLKASGTICHNEEPTPSSLSVPAAQYQRGQPIDPAVGTPRGLAAFGRGLVGRGGHLATDRLDAVGRIIQSGGQTTLRLTSNHAEASQVQSLLTGLSLFLSGLMNAAEQLPATERWRRIWHRILEPYHLPKPVPLTPSG